MHPAIQVRHDKRRGCGFRKGGGLYLVADGPSRPCGKLPIELSVCPACGGGIHFSRSWTWVEGDALAQGRECRSEMGCFGCPLSESLGRCGLLWIGEQFYPAPADWTRESMIQGISRRIPAVPREFKAGETWVLVAHKKAYWRPCGECTLTDNVVGAVLGDGVCPKCKGVGEIPVAAIFHAFRPTAVEYVVKGSETDEEIEALMNRGITPVQVEHAEETPLIPAEA